MRIIDAHAHLFNEENYLENLISVMDSCGIEKVCLSGLGETFHCVDNEGIQKAFQKYPERVIGAYYIRPGVSQFEEILEAYDRGFKMIKVTLPLQPYNKKRYYAYWEQAQKLEMPVLFHTGIVTTLERDPNHTINSWYMHPMRVEPIANSFPDLNIIIAHLGVHWNKDAAELVRMKPNVYVDLTGEPRGWRLYADQIGMDHYLWWEGAFKKVIFGTDVFYGKIRRILKRDKERYDTLGLNRKTKDLIFSGNILNMLNLE